MTAAYQKPILDSLTSALSNVTEFQTAVQVTDWILAELKEQVLAGNPGKSVANTPHSPVSLCVVLLKIFYWHIEHSYAS